jgi:uncharacterized membrane protein
MAVKLGPFTVFSVRFTVIVVATGTFTAPFAGLVLLTAGGTVSAVLNLKLYAASRILPCVSVTAPAGTIRCSHFTVQNRYRVDIRTFPLMLSVVGTVDAPMLKMFGMVVDATTR